MHEDVVLAEAYLRKDIEDVGDCSITTEDSGLLGGRRRRSDFLRVVEWVTTRVLVPPSRMFGRVSPFFDPGELGRLIDWMRACSFLRALRLELLID